MHALWTSTPSPSSPSRWTAFWVYIACQRFLKRNRLGSWSLHQHMVKLPEAFTCNAWRTLPSATQLQHNYSDSEWYFWILVDMECHLKLLRHATNMPHKDLETQERCGQNWLNVAPQSFQDSILLWHPAWFRIETQTDCHHASIVSHYLTFKVFFVKRRNLAPLGSSGFSLGRTLENNHTCHAQRQGRCCHRFMVAWKAIFGSWETSCSFGNTATATHCVIGPTLQFSKVLHCSFEPWPNVSALAPMSWSTF